MEHQQSISIVIESNTFIFDKASLINIIYLERFFCVIWIFGIIGLLFCLLILSIHGNTFCHFLLGQVYSSIICLYQCSIIPNIFVLTFLQIINICIILAYIYHVSISTFLNYLKLSSCIIYIEDFFILFFDCIFIFHFWRLKLNKNLLGHT